jgi:hypothetical protein
MAGLQRALPCPAMPLGFEVRNGSATLQVRAVFNPYAESWHNPSSGAFVISRRSPELHPVEGRRGIFVCSIDPCANGRGHSEGA